MSFKLFKIAFPATSRFFSTGAVSQAIQNVTVVGGGLMGSGIAQVIISTKCLNLKKYWVPTVSHGWSISAHERNYLMKSAFQYSCCNRIAYRLQLKRVTMWLLWMSQTMPWKSRGPGWRRWSPKLLPSTSRLIPEQTADDDSIWIVNLTCILFTRMIRPKQRSSRRAPCLALSTRLTFTRLFLMPILLSKQSLRTWNLNKSFLLILTR